MRPGSGVRYHDAVKALRGAAILDALRDLLVERDWTQVTVAQVAQKSGMSRQTIYKEFGSRTGLLQAYALRIASGVIAGVAEQKLDEHTGDVHASFVAGFERYFSAIGADPLVQSITSSDANAELVAKLAEYGEIFVDSAVIALANVYRTSWLALGDASDVLALGVVRVALSYLTAPPADAHASAEKLARLFVPYVEAARSAQSDA